MNSTGNKNTGDKGEQIAVSILKSKGFEIQATNWRNGRYGEIDIIALNPAQKLLLFVEVKTRRNLLFGEPIEAVTPKKQTQMLALGEAYSAAHPEYESYDRRFDIIGIHFSGKGKPADIIHLENALET
jgi:putative endonuclease